MFKQLGYEVYKTYDILWIADTKGVRVDRVCIGVDLIANLIILISAYPGKLKSKLLIIPLGILLMVALNSLRIWAILYGQVNHSNYAKYDFHYSYNLVVYIVIFLMWVLYVNLNPKVGKKT